MLCAPSAAELFTDTVEMYRVLRVNVIDASACPEAVILMGRI
jgi:hypothetical protein